MDTLKFNTNVQNWSWITLIIIYVALDDAKAEVLTNTNYYLQDETTTLSYVKGKQQFDILNDTIKSMFINLKDESVGQQRIHGIVQNSVTHTTVVNISDFGVIENTTQVDKGIYENTGNTSNIYYQNSKSSKSTHDNVHVTGRLGAVIDNPSKSHTILNLSQSSTPLPLDMTVSDAFINTATLSLGFRTNTASPTYLKVHKARTHRIQHANRDNVNKVFKTGYPKHHMKSRLKSSRHKRNNSEALLEDEGTGHNKFIPDHKISGTKSFTEIYGWIIGASMLLLGSLISLSGGLLLCYCGDKWNKHREERRRLHKYGEYVRVESVSSFVSSQDPVTSEYCEEPIESVSMI